jgi:hypothetical protein
MPPAAQSRAIFYTVSTWHGQSGEGWDGVFLRAECLATFIKSGAKKYLPAGSELWQMEIEAKQNLMKQKKV